MGFVAEHGVEEVDAASGEADEGGVVFLPSARFGSARGAVSVFRLVRFLGSPAEPGVPITEHRALHKSRSGGWWSLASNGPRCWNLRSSVAVANNPHPAWVEEVVLTVDRPPFAAAEATTEFFLGDLPVFSPNPSHYPFPGILGQVLERRGGHPGPEIGGPAAQHRIESAQHDRQGFVVVLPTIVLTLAMTALRAFLAG